ncbi:unnamed protein product [Brassica rapa subsp. trilocularis]
MLYKWKWIRESTLQIKFGRGLPHRNHFSFRKDNVVDNDQNIHIFVNA